MVKAIAEKHGFRATFMPKPFPHLTGKLGLSSLAYQFIGGVLHSAEAVCALTNPTVNSYKRINAPVTNSGATWSPNTISYTGNNRTHMIRIPESGRFEFRLADGAANPYLLPAAIIASGLDGIRQQRQAGQRYDNNSYTDPLPFVTVKQLPANLLDALRCLQANTILPDVLGSEFVQSYIKLKQREWKPHLPQV